MDYIKRAEKVPARQGHGNQTSLQSFGGENARGQNADPGAMRHGYRGAFEIIATVDYMAAFAATTGAVKTHHFDLAFVAFIEDEPVRAFIAAANRFGYDELIARFRDLRDRGLWTPQSNSAHELLATGSA